MEFLNRVNKYLKQKRNYNRGLKEAIAMQKIALKQIKEKTTLKVAFFVIHESVWKYDNIYQMMLADDLFNPQIFVCPYTSSSREVLENDMQKAYVAFKKKGYNVQKTLRDDGTWMDIKSEFKPDVVFFTNPHKVTKGRYFITQFLDTLTCYAPYNFGNCHLLKMFHDQNFHNYLWTLFAETEMHKEFSVQHARNKGENVVVSGFPGTDVFLTKTKDDIASPWKNAHTKKFIWAPHHSIDDDKTQLSYSSFLLYHEVFIEILKKYGEAIEIAFKPHPLLKVKLINHKDWGIEKTKAYYKKWKNLENGFLADGTYIDLFLTSDAMIHDSGSFLIEYLYTEKPVLRTDVDDFVRDRINSFGQMAYDVHYIARDISGVQAFIENTLKGIDPKKEERKSFKQQWLLPPNGKLASENIMDFLKSELT